MRTKIVELTNKINWGKFMLARFDRDEWAQPSQVEQEYSGMSLPLLCQCGWDAGSMWILDLQTGEGAMFRPGGNVLADLEKHAIWVCPMFPIFLTWLYARPEYWHDIELIPKLITLTDPETMAASALWGYRRPGPKQSEREGRG